MDIKHRWPQIICWRGMANNDYMYNICIYGCWQYHTPSANIDCFSIFKLYNNLYKCWIAQSSSEDINHINLLLTSRFEIFVLFAYKF